MSFNVELFMAEGDTVGKQHLNLYLQYIGEGKTPPQATLDFIAAAFAEILSGTDANKALMLNKPRKRPGAAGKRFDNELLIAILVYKLVHSRYMTLEEATGWVSDQGIGKALGLGNSEKTAERLYIKYKIMLTPLPSTVDLVPRMEIERLNPEDEIYQRFFNAVAEYKIMLTPLPSTVDLVPRMEIERLNPEDEIYQRFFNAVADDMLTIFDKWPAIELCNVAHFWELNPHLTVVEAIEAHIDANPTLNK